MPGRVELEAERAGSRPSDPCRPRLRGRAESTRLAARRSHGRRPAPARGRRALLVRARMRRWWLFGDRPSTRGSPHLAPTGNAICAALPGTAMSASQFSGTLDICDRLTCVADGHVITSPGALRRRGAAPARGECTYHGSSFLCSALCPARRRVHRRLGRWQSGLPIQPRAIDSWSRAGSF